MLSIPTATDDIVQMEVDVELTDHPANLNGAVLLVYLGINYPDVIVIGFQQFVVSRTGNERPDIDVNLFLVSPTTAMPFPQKSVDSVFSFVITKFVKCKNVTTLRCGRV